MEMVLRMRPMIVHSIAKHQSRLADLRSSIVATKVVDASLTVVKLMLTAMVSQTIWMGMVAVWVVVIPAKSMGL
jgi:hypothetical protein